MHGLWVGFIQEVILVCTQALILAGTYLLHKAVKSVNSQLQERMITFERQSEQ